jgi:hypothetical protein
MRRTLLPIESTRCDREGPMLQAPDTGSIYLVSGCRSKGKHGEKQLLFGITR